MSISLIAIRIVLSESSKKPCKSIDYTALKYSNLPMASNAVDNNETDNVVSASGQGHENDLRESRDITVEHYTNTKVDDPNEPGESSQAESGKTNAASISQVPFYIGNHFVEVIQGILHLYKENKLTPLGEESERSDIICMLSISAEKTIHDILQFTAPFNQDIQHIQIIRDSKPNQYMALLKFHTQRSADEFYNSFNGTAYNSIEPEVCHLAYVAQVAMMEEAKSTPLPISGFTELPTCPVCLERMDESVQGILTILCNHSFHGKCLDQWYDSTCPVCRYCQTPEPPPDHRCFECGSQSTTQDTLWICLICGHIGCGRYVEGHAYKHYRDTEHTYAMQLGLNNRVWDYAGDNYVHRLLQNKDGEPVELKANNSSSQIVSDEKIDAVQLEYTYLLTNQLETQRRYYEDSLCHIEKEKQQEIDNLIEKNRYLNDDNKKLSEILENLKRDKQQMEKKISHLSDKLNKTVSNFAEEQELNKSLRQNQEEWQRKLVEIEKSKEQKDSELKDLQEQLRDLMFFLEAKDKLKNVTEASKEEIESGHIYIQPSTSSPSVKSNRSKFRKGK